jgi:hypothetical protein
MVRWLCFWLGFIALAPWPAFAGLIPPVGPETGGVIQIGLFGGSAFDTEAFEQGGRASDVSFGGDISNGPSARSFKNFDGNVLVDPTRALLGQNNGCVSAFPGGAAFCSQPYLSGSGAVRMGDTVVVLPAASGDYLTDSDPFAVKNTFAGAEPIRASFSSDVPTVVPEPSTLILFGTGIPGIAALLRTRKT